MDHIFNGTFYASQPDLNWVGEGMINFLEHSLSLICTIQQPGTAYSRG